GKEVIFEHVQRLEGTDTGTNKKLTIGILVARSKDKITNPAKDRAKVAKSNGYNIILTDENNLYLDLINFIESHPLDSSDNKKEEKEKGNVCLEMERRELESGNELMHIQMEN
ncbi:2026_t:CDS:1, partial [Paraglomus brasilianum]